MSQYLALKSEPSVYSFDQLVKDKKTNWNGDSQFSGAQISADREKGRSRADLS